MGRRLHFFEDPALNFKTPMSRSLHLKTPDTPTASTHPCKGLGFRVQGLGVLGLGVWGLGVSGFRVQEPTTNTPLSVRRADHAGGGPAH